MFAASLCVMLALLFATLLMLADARAMSVKRVESESHYAAPATPPMERSSMVPAVQVVSDGGW